MSMRFSALQRAENSSNRNLMYMRDALERFSALQRAENSSNELPYSISSRIEVSVLFSEPKIPQNTHDSETSTDS